MMGFLSTPSSVKIGGRGEGDEEEMTYLAKILTFSTELPEKKRWALTFLFGALLSLAFPPLNWTPFAVLSLWSFYGILLPPSLSLSQGFALGWWFGFGFFTTGLYWIAFSLGIEIERFWWLVPFTVLGLPAFLALFMGFQGAFLVLSRTQGWGRWVLFALLWTLMEWIRGHILSGFPWNLVGYIWLPWVSILQVTSLLGIYGLSFLTVLSLTVPGLLQDSEIRHPKLWMGGTVGIVLLGVSLGALRLSCHPSEKHDNILIRLVQPNIRQSEKWESTYREQNFETLIRLIQLPSNHPIDYIITPESAVPFYLEQDLWHRHALAASLPPGTRVFLGLLRGQWQEEAMGALSEGTGKKRFKLQKVWNSFAILDSEGHLEGFYDKSHLVPFGEYVPLRSWLPGFFKKITPGALDFSAGVGRVTVHLSGVLPFSPLICYEGIFPSAVVAHEGDSTPEWLVNITNDAWFGPTSGPYQHFGLSRVRAIEEGIPLVRCANTGISGIIDPYGRILGTLALNTRGILDLSLPKAIPGRTLYARFGDTLLFVILLILGGIIYIRHKKSVFLSKRSL